MKKLKIILISAVCVLCALGLSCLTIFGSIFTNNGGYTSCLSVNEETNMLSTNNNSVKILQLTDTQLHSCFDSASALNCVKKTVAKTNPDLIVLTGDNVSDPCTKKSFNRLVNFLDAFGLPWAVVMGNHDYGVFHFTTEYMNQAYLNSKHCIYKQGPISNSLGNYYYTINFNGNNSFSLIFMDSQQLGFTQEHVTWYEQTINTITQDNGLTLPSFAFFHIPTTETVTACQQYQQGLIEGSGTLREHVCPQETNSNFFEKVVELNSTKALFYGHDHVNDLILNYQGIKLVYGIKTGKTSYFNPKIQGGNLITINADQTFDIIRIYV